MTRFIFFVLTALLTILPVFSQTGSWKSYTDMKDIRAVAVHSGTVYSATTGGAFQYSGNGQDYTQFTNTEGLASIDLTSSFFDSKGRWFVGTSSGHICELLSNSRTWRTIPDIARTTSLPRRAIRAFVEYLDMIYIATDFGVVIYNPSTKEFADTWSKFGAFSAQIGVNGVLFRNDSIWLATDEGIAAASMKTSNLKDPQNWLTYNKNNGITDSKVNAVAVFRDAIVAATATNIVTLSGSQWVALVPEVNGNIKKMSTFDEYLFCALEYEALRVSPTSEIRYIGAFLLDGSYPEGTSINDFAVINPDSLYIATNLGFATTSYNPVKRNPWHFLYPNGPNSNRFLSLSIDTEGNLWSASGRDGNGRGVYCFDGTMWKNYSKANTVEFQTDDIVITEPGLNGDMWFGSWGEGIYRRTASGELNAYNYRTVPGYPGISNDSAFNITGGIAVDRDGTVYTIHPGNDKSFLSRFSTDGKWCFYQDPAIQSVSDYGNVVIDEYGNKWIIAKDGSRKGIVVFNDNKTADDKSDDTWTSVSASSDRDLLANDISSLVVDGFGDIWVGTNAGIRTIFNPLEPNRVTRTCYNTRCNIEGEAITCLAVDPVNNKWIGTNSGVFVLSNDGSTILAQYNTENSLLLDNKINSIAVHPATGVAYIGTNKGLSALQTPYQQAQPGFTEIRVFPNPFKPKSDDILNIQGLVENSSIKILSASGNLVTEFATPGGNIGFWNGRTSTGEWAPTGIYFIAAYSADGKQAALGKVAVINE